MASRRPKAHNNRRGLWLHSIRFRLTVWYVLILALVLLVFGSVVYASQAQSLRAELENNVRADVQRLAEAFPFGKDIRPEEAIKGESALMSQNDIALAVDQNGNVMQAVGRISNTEVSQVMEVTGLAGRKSASQISDQIRKLKSTQSDDPKTKDEITRLLKILQDAPRSSDLFFTLTLNDHSASGFSPNYLLYSTPLLLNGYDVGTLILGRPRQDETQLQGLLVALLLAAPLTLLVAAGGGYWLAARAMRPVRAITRAAQEMGETELHRRLDLGGRDELGELAATFDGMLDRLEGSFKRQRQFTADASHELRTPLTIVDLEVDRALASHRTEGEYRRALAIVQAENRQMTRLVGNLLTLARADSKRATLTPEKFDLSDLTLDVVERLEPLAMQKGVALSTGNLPELVVEGDRAYLGQMLSNLVENAIKYCSCSGHERWVRVETACVQRQEGMGASIRVQDNGLGIPAEHLPHLFDRFYRVDAARTHSGDSAEGRNIPEGSGLGLSIAQWVAEAHNGEISVQSEVGEGSTFEVRLPLLKAISTTALLPSSKDVTVLAVL
jgi:signal transduction histidine kinase